jgi:hypothetical protein
MTSDEFIEVSFMGYKKQYPNPNMNRRFYPPEVVEKALKLARKEQHLKEIKEASLLYDVEK